MNDYFYRQLINSNAHRKDRDENAYYILSHPEQFPRFLALCLNVEDPNHFKACWALELVLENQIDWLAPHLDDFCKALRDFDHDSALRSISKICLFAATRHFGNPKRDFLSSEHIEQMTDACFGWVIGSQKVATKAYAIRALSEFGKIVDWVYPELIPVLQKGYPEHSAAYKVVARETLAKINRDV